MKARELDKTNVRPTRRASLTPCLLVSVSLVTVGCDLPGRPNPADRPVPADEVLDFDVLYRQNCAGCHGSNGALGPAPPLNDPLFRAIIPEEELESIVTQGRNKTLMPAFATENGGVLTAAQIQVLVKQIKGIRYRIVEKQEGGVAKVDVVPDAGGISPKWGVLGKPPSGVPTYLAQSSSSKGSGWTRFCKPGGSVPRSRNCFSRPGGRRSRLARPGGSPP